MPSMNVDLSDRKDWTNYRGAWLYPTPYGYEANYKGFHYEASSIEALCRKIDGAIDYEQSLPSQDYITANKRSYIPFLDEDDNTTAEWAIVFQLNSDDTIDDDFSETPFKEVVIQADDFDSAVKYAQQYIRKMTLNSETHDQWVNAEVVSIDLR